MQMTEKRDPAFYGEHFNQEIARLRAIPRGYRLPFPSEAQDAAAQSRSSDGAAEQPPKSQR